MAETFTSLYNLLYAQVAFKTTKTTTILKQSMVEALDLLGAKAPFSEEEASFLTTANDPTYDSATTGFPKDLKEISRLYYKTGSTKPIEIPTIDMDTLRFWMDEVPVQFPRGRAWHDRKLYLGPPPNSVMTLYMDYLKDARRDAATGALITTASTTQTNDWFDAGLTALKHAVLEVFYKNTLFMDQGRAAFNELQKNNALALLAEERRQLVQPSGRAVAAWTAGEANETVWSGWRGQPWSHE